MANPNIAATSNVLGTTWVQAVGTSATAIVTAASSTVVKLESLYVGNVDTSAAYFVTVDLYRSSVAYRILYRVSIPAGAGLDVISKAIYLNEGDSIRLTADTAAKLEAVASGEVIS
jgi:hypothetical protein